MADNFSSSERSAIAASTKANVITDGNQPDGSVDYDAYGYAALSSDKIFFLDVREVLNKSYGYHDGKESMGACRVKTDRTGNAFSWWLRSKFAEIEVCLIYSDTVIDFATVSENRVCVSPALNVNRSSILFSSVISDDAGSTGAEYKLTLLDSDISIAVSGDVTRNNNIITVPYTITGDNSANVSQVSVLILDKEYTVGNTNGAKIFLYYGALQNATEGAASGTGTFELPSGLDGMTLGKD